MLVHVVNYCRWGEDVTSGGGKVMGFFSWFMTLTQIENQSFLGSNLLLLGIINIQHRKHMQIIEYNMLLWSIEHGHRIWFVLWAFYSLPGGNRIFPDQAPRRFGANCKLSTSLTQFVYRKHRLCCASLKKCKKSNTWHTRTKPTWTMLRKWMFHPFFSAFNLALCRNESTFPKCGSRVCRKWSIRKVNLLSSFRLRCQGWSSSGKKYRIESRSVSSPFPLPVKKDV